MDLASCSDQQFIIARLGHSGQWEVFDYINKLGGSSLTSASWQESSFDWKRWFIAEPDFTARVLFNYKIIRCSAKYLQKLCLTYGSIYYYDDLMKNDVEYIMQHLQKVDKNLIREASDDFLEFLLLKKFFKNQIQSSKNLTSEKVIRIIDLQEKFPDVDWLQAINKQLLWQNRVQADEMIVIVKPQLFQKLYQEAVEYNKA